MITTSRRYTDPQPVTLPSTSRLVAPTPNSGLTRAVPATRPLRTNVVVHRHQIVVQRTDTLYKIVAIAESALLIASSVALISLSAATALMAASVLAG